MPSKCQYNGISKANIIISAEYYLVTTLLVLTLPSASMVRLITTCPGAFFDMRRPLRSKYSVRTVPGTACMLPTDVGVTLPSL